MGKTGEVCRGVWVSVGKTGEVCGGVWWRRRVLMGARDDEYLRRRKELKTAQVLGEVRHTSYCTIVMK